MQLVELRGTWEEIGWAHGKQLGPLLDEVDQLVATKMLPMLRMDGAALREDARFAALLNNAPAWFWMASAP